MIGWIRQLFDQRRYAFAGARGPAAGISDVALPLNDGERRPLEDRRHGRGVIRGAAAAFYWTAGLFAAIILKGYGQRRHDTDG